MRRSPGISVLANSRWNVLGFACQLAANFVVVPFVVRWIGIEQFGTAGLVLAIAAPFSLVGIVLGQALVREMAANLGAGEFESAARMRDAGLRLGTAASAASSIALLVSGPAIAEALAGPGTAAARVTPFAVVAAGLFAQQVSLVLQGVAAARQDFRTIAGVAAIGSAATVALTLGITASRPDATGYLAGVAASFGATLVCWGWIQRREWRRLGGAGQRHETRCLLRFGGWQALAQLAGTMGNQIDRYALGVLAPVAVIGQYNVANRLQEAAYVGVMKVAEVLFPHFGALANRPLSERRNAFQSASWVMTTFSAMLLVPLVPLASSVLDLWVGPDSGPDAARMLQVLVLGGIVGCGSNVFVYYAMGIGRNEPVAWISVLYSTTTVLTTVVLIGSFGAQAAGLGLLAASIVRVAVALLATRLLLFPDVDWRDLSASTLVPLCVGIGLALAVRHSGIAHAEGWLALLAQYAVIAALVLAATVAASLLTRSGREIVERVRASMRSQPAPLR